MHFKNSGLIIASVYPYMYLFVTFKFFYFFFLLINCHLEVIITWHGGKLHWALTIGGYVFKTSGFYSNSVITTHKMCHACHHPQPQISWM